MMDNKRRDPSDPSIYYQEREAAIYDLEYSWKTDDIPFWQGLTTEYAGTQGRALELACGTLRILLPVAQSGVSVMGIDHSPWMLEHARKKLAQAAPEVQARVRLAEGDMRHLDLHETFNLIYLPFNTFLMLQTVEDQLSLFESVRAHLAPGGVFAFDLFVPDVNRLANKHTGPELWGLEVDRTLESAGLRFQRDVLREVDTKRQIIKNTFRMKEYENGLLVREWLSDLQVRYVFPFELEHLVAHAGFEFVHYWGEYDRTDFWAMDEQWKQLAVVRARP